MDIGGSGIIVTGGANGLGLALSRELAARGAKVGVIDVDREALEALEDTAGILPLLCDITHVESCAECVRAFVEEAGTLHALVNNAGVVANAPLLNLRGGDEDVRTWDRVISTNLNGAYYMTRAAASAMMQRRTRGVMVNVGSICAAGNAGQGAYSAAKAGMRALTVTWAKELGPLGIRVAGIAPGYVETRTTLESMSEEVVRDWKKATPLRRMGSPDEVVDAVLFILGNDFFNGRTLELDGGLRM